jgi:hypothetical protein
LSIAGAGVANIAGILALAIGHNSLDPEKQPSSYVAF